MLTDRQKQNTPVPVKHWIPERVFKIIQQTVPIATVDLLLLRKGKNGAETLLIKRSIYPETGKWCAIGGRILRGESTLRAIRRQARRELGISVKILRPWDERHPFATYNDPVKDAQKHFVGLTFPVVMVKGRLRTSGPEFSESRWFPIDSLPRPLGFHFKEVYRDLAKAIYNSEIHL